jgi:hypothetical protein
VQTILILPKTYINAKVNSFVLERENKKFESCANVGSNYGQHQRPQKRKAKIDPRLRADSDCPWTNKRRGDERPRPDVFKRLKTHVSNVNKKVLGLR